VAFSGPRGKGEKHKNVLQLSNHPSVFRVIFNGQYSLYREKKPLPGGGRGESEITSRSLIE
jgi:uncharacterized protein YbdZ (MbtH family)